jgi:hypothetical protein
VNLSGRASIREMCDMANQARALPPLRVEDGPPARWMPAAWEGKGAARRVCSRHAIDGVRGEKSLRVDPPARLTTSSRRRVRFWSCGIRETTASIVDKFLARGEGTADKPWISSDNWARPRADRHGRHGRQVAMEVRRRRK